MFIKKKNHLQDLIKYNKFFIVTKNQYRPLDIDFDTTDEVGKKSLELFKMLLQFNYATPEQVVSFFDAQEDPQKVLNLVDKYVDAHILNKLAVTNSYKSNRYQDHEPDDFVAYTLNYPAVDVLQRQLGVSYLADMALNWSSRDILGSLPKMAKNLVALEVYLHVKSYVNMDTFNARIAINLAGKWLKLGFAFAFPTKNNDGENIYENFIGNVVFPNEAILELNSERAYNLNALIGYKDNGKNLESFKKIFDNNADHANLVFVVFKKEDIIDIVNVLEQQVNGTTKHPLDISRVKFIYYSMLQTDDYLTILDIKHTEDGKRQVQPRILGDHK